MQQGRAYHREVESSIQALPVSLAPALASHLPNIKSISKITMTHLVGAI